MPLQNSPLSQTSPQQFGQQSSPEFFLDDIKMRIVNCTPDLTKDKVFFSKYTNDDLIDFAPADVFVALSIPTSRPNAGYISGGGNYNTQFDSTLLVRIFVRNEGDLENRSFSLMSDKIVGEWAFAHRIVKALSMWVGPIDPKTNFSLLNRPMTIIGDIESLDKSAKSTKQRWGITQARFQLPFVMDLEYPYPTGAGLPSSLPGVPG